MGLLALTVGIFVILCHVIYCFVLGKPMFPGEDNETEPVDNSEPHDYVDSETKNDNEPLEMTRVAARAGPKAKGFLFHNA